MSKKEINTAQAENIIVNLSEGMVEVIYQNEEDVKTDKLPPEAAANYWKEATVGIADTDYEGDLPHPSEFGSVYEGASYVNTAPVELEVNQGENLEYTVATELRDSTEDRQLSISGQIPYQGSIREMKMLAGTLGPEEKRAYMNIVDALS